MAPEEKMKMKLNWNLLSRYRTQLYALSILLVFAFHVEDYFPKQIFFERIPKYIIQSGNIGVDIFLFLSGVSMYYSMKKSAGLAGFYRRRYWKIAKIYLFFCVPYFIGYYLTGRMSLQTFIKQVTFTRERVNSFWFLLCIVICYTIYPLIYRLVSTGREKLVWGILCLYILGMVLLNALSPAAFAYDEILFMRIPIFVVGGLAGKKVYEKEEISPGFLFLLLLCLLGKDIMKYLYSALPLFKANKTIIARLFAGVQGVGMAFFMVILLQYFEGTAGYRLLSKLGTITLEFYVTHIAFMHILLDILKIRPVTRRGVLLISVVWFCLSLAVSVLLNKLLYRRRSGKSS